MLFSGIFPQGRMSLGVYIPLQERIGGAVWIILPLYIYHSSLYILFSFFIYIPPSLYIPFILYISSLFIYILCLYDTFLLLFIYINYFLYAFYLFILSLYIYSYIFILYISLHIQHALLYIIFFLSLYSNVKYVNKDYFLYIS